LYLAHFRSIAQKKDINFIYPSLYAWGGPALLTALVVVLNMTTDNETFSPGIGLRRCWFNGGFFKTYYLKFMLKRMLRIGYSSELIYYIAPLVILLTLNLVFFSLTAKQLWRVRKESKRAFRGSSRVHAPPGQRQQNKDRFTLYAKLFLLMGVTWIMEVVSWAVGGPESIWYFTDSVNYLRGCLIFWFCVWSKKDMRKVFLETFTCCKKSTTQETLDMTSKDASSVSTTSTTTSGISQA
jgi:G protein-coupled receptor Mth (Methuselah protein)